MAESLIVAALNKADADLAAEYEGVEPWYVGEHTDHVYSTCPALSGRPLRPGAGRLYPEGGDLCGWCARVWRARKARAEKESNVQP